MSSRAFKRNTQGGKSFKQGPKGGKDQFRTVAAAAAANELLDLILLREKVGLDKMEKEDRTALCELQVGRVSRKLGNGRMEVYCQDGTVRNCAIRGLLKRKGACFIDVDTFVVVALAVPLDELEESDDEGVHGGGKVEGGEFKSNLDHGFIAGIFDANALARLRKTQINPKVFICSAQDDGLEKLFDRTAAAGGGGAEAAEEAAAAGGKAKRKGKGSGGSGSDEVKVEDL